MKIVDSSVWIAYFNGKSLPETDALAQMLENNDQPVLFPVIKLEILAGFKEDSDFKSARSVFERLVTLDLPADLYVEAAALYRALRRKGITVRGVTDCLIAQGCIYYGVSLLTLDRDFKTIARHSDLKLA